MWIPILSLLAGFALLVWSADRFVEGAAATSRNLGVSPLVIGLLVVGFGTSAPEMLISGLAAWNGNTGISIGNAVGSNITNIALILGITALFKPLSVHSRLVSRELPILLAAVLFSLILLLDGTLGRVDGWLLLAGFGVLIYWTLALAMRERNGGSVEVDPLAGEFEAEIPTMSTGRALLWLAVGLAVLLASSRLLVWAAVEIAVEFGISDLVIGLTVIAIGTSLPELAATISAARKDEHDIAIGNVIGSNTFNVLAVLGLPGAIAPGAVLPELLTRDYPVMIGLTLALFAMAYGFRSEGRITRWEGGALLSAFVAYQLVLYL